MQRQISMTNLRLPKKVQKLWTHRKADVATEDERKLCASISIVKVKILTFNHKN